MKTMKVAMYYNNNDVRIEELPIPSITDDGLLVKVLASGICGSDVMEWYRIKKAPRVLGHEIAGDIVEVGKKVKKYKVGDRVFVSHHVPCDECHFCENDQHTLCHTLHTTNFDPGGFAEYLRVPKINVEKGVFILPDEVSYEEGVFIEPLACVVRGMHIARMQKGQTVLIIGSGISGLLHIKLAQLQKAHMVIATDVNPSRLQWAKTIGADYALNAKDDVPGRVRKITKGKLADLVVTCTGAPAAVTQAQQCVAFGGTILFFAPTQPGVNIPFSLFDLWNKGVTMVSTYAGSPRDIKKAIALLQKKKLDVTDMISHKFPLSKTAQGFKLVAEADTSMKVIIEPQK
jgi:L-iditol 2-dehydrogenase